MANSCLFSSCSKHIYSRCIRNRNVLYAKNMNNNTQSAAVASETTQSDDSSSSDSAQLAAYKNGKKVLTIPEIAEQVGPSVVGVINKTTVQPQNITIRSAEDIIIQAATEAQTVKPLNKAAVRELFSKTTVTS